MSKRNKGLMYNCPTCGQAKHKRHASADGGGPCITCRDFDRDRANHSQRVLAIADKHRRQTGRRFDWQQEAVWLDWINTPPGQERQKERAVTVWFLDQLESNEYKLVRGFIIIEWSAHYRAHNGGLFPYYHIIGGPDDS